MKNILKTLIIALLFTSPLNSAENKSKLLEPNWTFDGFFGKFDKEPLQRGYQVYKEVLHPVIL